MTIGAVILMMRTDALFCRQVCSSSQTTRGARFRCEWVGHGADAISGLQIRAPRLDELATAVPSLLPSATRRMKNRLNEKSTFAEQAVGL
jgi:hypothetical protein